MPLKIEIVSYGMQSVDAPQSVVFEMTGGTIGRSVGNHIVLPDESKFISRSHVQISYENGRYYLTDTSTNGTLICNRDLQLKGNREELAHGDRLRIGDYELLVSILEPPKCEPEITTGVNLHRQPSANVPKEWDCLDEFFKDSVVIRPAVKSEVIPEPDFIPDLPTAPQLQERHTLVTEPIRTAGGEDRTQTAANTAAAEVEEKETGPNREDSYRKLFDLFMQGAQIEDTSFIESRDIPELMKTIGATFREMTYGLWKVLQGRAEQKSEMRALMTRFANTGNNPLKSFPRLEDVLRSLVKRVNPAYLEPVDAVREGFEDLMNHHMAINAGIQASLEAILGRFDPDCFAQKHEGGLSFMKKGKCWDDYCRSYDKLMSEAMEEFLGKAFVEAYEEQVGRLGAKKKTS